MEPMGTCSARHVLQMQYNQRMKTALIPQVRVEPELRQQLEDVLDKDETLSDFVEDAVRRAVERRRVESAFLARGRAALDEFQRTGKATPADQVLDEMQARLAARVKKLQSK